MSERRFTVASLVDSSETLPPLNGSARRIYQGILEGLAPDEIAATYRIKSNESTKAIKELSYSELFRRVLVGEISVTGISPEPLAQLDRLESYVWASMVSDRERKLMRLEYQMGKEQIRFLSRKIARKWGIEGQHKRARVVAYGAAAFLRGENFLMMD